MDILALFYPCTGEFNCLPSLSHCSWGYLVPKCVVFVWWAVVRCEEAASASRLPPPPHRPREKIILRCLDRCWNRDLSGVWLLVVGCCVVLWCVLWYVVVMIYSGDDVTAWWSSVVEIRCGGCGNIPVCSGPEPRILGSVENALFWVRKLPK